MQRVLASYRVPFFDMLAERFEGNLSVYAGKPRESEMIDQSQRPKIASYWPAKNIHLFHGGAYCCIQRDVVQWLNQENPDVLIMEANQRYPMSALAARWMHQRGRKVIGWGLGTGKANTVFQRLFLCRFNALITYSLTGAERYKAAGFCGNRIFIACNAASGKPNRPMPNRFPDSFDGRPILLFVGRLQQRKRVNLLIQACGMLQTKYHPRLWIVGDGSIRQELETTAKTTYPDTEFFGALYGKALQERFDQADLFVLPGTGGLALQQAMASGLPVAAAEADGTQTDLVRPENGRILMGGDLDNLVMTIDDLLSDPKRLRTMGAASFQIVDQEINLESMCDVFENAIAAVSREEA